MFTALFILPFLLQPCHCLIIHKCCPLGEILRSTQCINQSTITNESSHADWFPYTALFNRTTELPLDKAGVEQVKMWVEAASVVDGEHSGDLAEGLLFSHSNASYTRAFDFKIFVNSEDDFEVLTNVHHRDKSTHSLDAAFMVPIQEICLDRHFTGTYMIAFPNSKTFVQKCCSHDHLLDLTHPDMCINISHHPNIKSDDWRPQMRVNDEDVDLAVGRNPFSRCESLDYYYTYYCRGFRLPPKLFINGSVLLDTLLVDKGEFCAETIVGADGPAKHNILYCNLEEIENSTSTHSNELHAMKRKMTTFGVMFILGGFFLLITVAISLYLPQLRQRLHNRIAITHNVALMVANFAWAPTFFRDSNENDGCSIRALVIQYTFLASLFWLNVFCINMSSTFRSSISVSSYSARSENRRYIVYSLYAWGMPAVISLFTIIMEVVEEPPYGIIRPGLTCYCDFARETMAVFVYLYGPMTILLTFNLVLYVFTTWKIISVHRQTASVLKRMDSSAQQQNDYQKLILYTKLFVVMGITWTMEIFTWVANLEDTTFSFVWEMLNIMRPIFIFVIFICKRSVFIALREKILILIGRAPTNDSCDVTEAMSSSVMGSRKASRQEESTSRRPSDDRGAQEMMIMKPYRKTNDACPKIWLDGSEPLTRNHH